MINLKEKKTLVQVTRADQTRLVGTVTEDRSCAPATPASPTETRTRSASSASTTATAQEVALAKMTSALGRPILRVLRALSRCIEPPKDIQGIDGYPN